MAKDPSKTEQATPKRRDKAREEGNVPKAQEVSKVVTIIAGLIMLYVYSGFMIERIKIIFKYIFQHAVEIPLEDGTDAYKMFHMLVTELTIIVLPVLVTLFVVVLITMRLQVGPLWTTKIFKFKWEKFNVFKGVGRLFFSLQTVTRMGKSLGFALVIGYIPYLYITNEYPNFIKLYNADAAGVATYMVSQAFKMVVYTLLPMIAIAIFDLWYTRHDYEENLKMSKQEVKDEHRQSEGDPLVKQRQKQKMFAMMTNRMFQDVPRADVVITNPTHFAVALMYDPTVSSAPIVVAKGADHIAFKIREIAAEHNVPIRENKPLAQALYKQAEVGDIIPEDLYKAVAALLAQIWKLKGKKMQK